MFPYPEDASRDWNTPMRCSEHHVGVAALLFGWWQMQILAKIQAGDYRKTLKQNNILMCVMAQSYLQAAISMHCYRLRYTMGWLGTLIQWWYQEKKILLMYSATPWFLVNVLGSVPAQEATKETLDNIHPSLPQPTPISNPVCMSAQS